MTGHGEPKAFCNGSGIYVWIRPANDPNAEWDAKVYDATSKQITVPTANAKYCIKYLENNTNAQFVRIKSDYIPNTYKLVLKENLYQAGETNSSQTKVGYVQITIPRFQLDGSQDLSMSMTGASTTSLKGSALISEGCGDANCEGTGYYADMIQVLEGDDWTKGIIALAVEGGDQTIATSTTKSLDVYAIKKDSTPRKLTNDVLVASGLGFGFATSPSESPVASAAASANAGSSIDITSTDTSGSAAITVILNKLGEGGSETPIVDVTFDVSVRNA